MRSAVKLAAAGGLAAAFTVLAAFGQSAVGQAMDKPRFPAADVHVTVKTQGNQATRPPVARGEIFEARNVTMVDLINFAYNTNVTRVVGGPNWIEMDRFDVFAKLPTQTAQDQQRLMLRDLLADRFKLVARDETRPAANYALSVGAKHKLKEADGSGQTGCVPQSSNAPPGAAGVLRATVAGEGGTPIQIAITDGAIEYKCRNITMAAFATGLRSFLVSNLGSNPVLDQTGLSGIWNFDLKYALGLTGLATSASPIFEAVDKQLGLKLEEKQVPTSVLFVESVNRTPIANPPGTAEGLPRVVVPKEFEVATIKPTDPGSTRQSIGMQPTGRFTSEGLPLRTLISLAFPISFAAQLVGVPDWTTGVRYDVAAQAQVDGNQPLDTVTVAPLMQALLKERFGLTFHTEQRQVDAYDLAAGKPKMKASDPNSRTWCKAPAQVPGAAPAPQGSSALICQNVTMSQFAELLRGRTPELQVPPGDATGIEGGWDFRLTFNPVINLAGAAAAVPRAAADGAAAPAQAAPTPLAASADPIAGISIFDALEKQLGLKLEKVKRTATVYVVDHVDRTPTEN